MPREGGASTYRDFPQIKTWMAGSSPAMTWRRGTYEHPVVLPQVSHFMQVPLRTSVKFWHSPQASPS